MEDPLDIVRLSERVSRLEESQGFAERAAEGVSAEVFALTRRLDELARRLDRLDTSVRSAAQVKKDADTSAGAEH